MTTVSEQRFRRRQYLEPPVVEAVARLYLAQPSPWTLTTPGLIFSRVQSDYPREPEFQNIMQAELSAGPGAQPNMQVRSGPQKVVFGNSEGSRLLIVGARDISAHALAPYEGWESLLNRLMAAVDLLDDDLPMSSFTGLGVRYVNRVVIPESEFRFEDYLTIGFTGPPGLPSNVTSFFDRVESIYPDGKTRVSFTWATVDAEPESASFVLDFDLNLNCVEGEVLSVEEARTGLEELKRKETDAFESLLQDRLREVFREIN